jgi:DNA repair ATPase RecN
MSEDLTKKLPKGDDNVALILQNIDSRLLSLEQRVEERLHDTRPIWQKVVADIAQLQAGQTQLQESQQRIAETMSLEFREIKTSIRDLFRRFSMVNDTLATIQIDYRDIYDRVRGLEIQQKPSNSST